MVNQGVPELLWVLLERLQEDAVLWAQQKEEGADQVCDSRNSEHRVSVLVALVVVALQFVDAGRGELFFSINHQKNLRPSLYIYTYAEAASFGSGHPSFY